MGKEKPRGRFTVFERRGFIPPPSGGIWMGFATSLPKEVLFQAAVCESPCWFRSPTWLPSVRAFFIFPEYSPVSDRLRSTRYGSCFMQLALLRTVVPLGFLLSCTESAILLAQDLRLFLRKFTQSTSLGRQPDNGASWRKL